MIQLASWYSKRCVIKQTVKINLFGVNNNENTTK